MVNLWEWLTEKVREAGNGKEVIEIGVTDSGEIGLWIWRRTGVGHSYQERYTGDTVEEAVLAAIEKLS